MEQLSSDGVRDSELILQQRAAKLAKPAGVEQESYEQVEIIEFMLEGERYGIEVDWVEEVSKISGVTPLVKLPPCFAGVVNIRGKILAAIDLRPILRLPQNHSSKADWVIVVANNDVECALLVDEILGTSFLAAEEIQQSVAGMETNSRNLCKGITRESLAILDGSRLLDDRLLSIS